MWTPIRAAKVFRIAIHLAGWWRAVSLETWTCKRRYWKAGTQRSGRRNVRKETELAKLIYRPRNKQGGAPAHVEVLAEDGEELSEGAALIVMMNAVEERILSVMQSIDEVSDTLSS